MTENKQFYSAINKYELFLKKIKLKINHFCVFKCFLVEEIFGSTTTDPYDSMQLESNYFYLTLFAF